MEHVTLITRSFVASDDEAAAAAAPVFSVDVHNLGRTRGGQELCAWIPGEDDRASAVFV